MSKHSDVNRLIEKAQCPLCSNGLFIRWSHCGDQGCCGILDNITCEDHECEFQILGNFIDLTEESLNEKLKPLSSEDRIVSLEKTVKDLFDQVAKLRKDLG